MTDLERAVLDAELGYKAGTHSLDALFDARRKLKLSTEQGRAEDMADYLDTDFEKTGQRMFDAFMAFDSHGGAYTKRQVSALHRIRGLLERCNDIVDDLEKNGK